VSHCTGDAADITVFTDDDEATIDGLPDACD
jgi:hypothetical protein